MQSISIPLVPPPPPSPQISPPPVPHPLSDDDLPERRAWNRLLTSRDTVMKKAQRHSDEYNRTKGKLDIYTSATTTLTALTSGFLVGALANPIFGYCGFACSLGNFCLGRFEAACDIRNRATKENVVLLQIESLVTELNAIIARSDLSPAELNTIVDNVNAKIQVIELNSHS